MITLKGVDTSMKKFIIVMISFLVLFVFLMLNYLLWDKENLQKERESDKIEQDWLRGQNRTLQSTISEHERTIQSLEGKNNSQKEQISILEQQLTLSEQIGKSREAELAAQKEAVTLYKEFTAPALVETVRGWFADISEANYEGSYLKMAENATVFGSNMSKEAYIMFISVFKSLTVVEETEENLKVYEFINDREDIYQIHIQLKADILLKEEKPELPGFSLTDGINVLDMVFLWNSTEKYWAILVVSTVPEIKP